jgi:hypothetical protein
MTQIAYLRRKMTLAALRGKRSNGKRRNALPKVT